MHLKILKKSLISRLQEKWMEKTNLQKCKWSLNAKQWVIDAFESVIFPMKYVNLSDGNHVMMNCIRKKCQHQEHFYHHEYWMLQE